MISMLRRSFWSTTNTRTPDDSPSTVEVTADYLWRRAPINDLTYMVVLSTKSGRELAVNHPVNEKIFAWTHLLFFNDWLEPIAVDNKNAFQ